MLYMTREERQISLEKMVNTRDLGGYETQGGKYSKAHKYIRASAPTYATKKDIADLKVYGVKVVIDLRSDFEKECQKNPFKDDPDIDFYEVNLFDSSTATIVPDEVKMYKDLGGVYIYMLEGMKDKFKELFDIFVKYPYEGIMFHCSAGKDRTGVTSVSYTHLNCEGIESISSHSSFFVSSNRFCDIKKDSYHKSNKSLVISYINRL